MPMIPFMEKFPELAAAETRSARVAGHESLPDGDYGFFELYCNEPGCDCRRVIVTVLREDTGWRPSLNRMTGRGLPLTLSTRRPNTRLSS